MRMILVTKRVLLSIIIILCISVVGCGIKDNKTTEVTTTNTTNEAATNKDNTEDTKEQEEKKEENQEDIEGEETEKSEKIQDESTEYPFVYIDSLDREITIEAEPQRIISAGPNLTENICAIGAQDKLIGRTSYCNYPESVQSIEEIGDTMTLSVEKIIELNPDVVFLTSLINPEIIESIESQGIDVIAVYQQENLQGAYDLLINLGKILNKQSESKTIIDSMKERIDKVSKEVSKLNKPTVYYMISYGEYGDFTATSDTYIHEIIQLAGGDNIAKDSTNWMFSFEQLVEADPDIIILSKNFDTKELFVAAEGYKDLTAVKEGRVYEIDDDAIGRQGQGTADALEELAQIFHSEIE